MKKPDSLKEKEQKARTEAIIIQLWGTVYCRKLSYKVLKATLKSTK
jgi:hypothetical protein